MKTLLYVLSLLMPWPVRRLILVKVFRYEIDPTAKIGIGWIRPAALRLGPGARIGHLNVVKGLNRLEMGRNTIIGPLNWISAFPTGHERHFAHIKGRETTLTLDDEAAITSRHFIDCTCPVRIGRFTTLAGYRTQILTHSINLQDGRQDAHPIEIGEYCFVGTACTILGGAKLPSYSVLGANSLLAKALAEEGVLYAGVPARKVKEIDRNGKYFTRREGFVY
ncbi:MAG: acyltransferase [Fimbriimonadaceae bacterium]